MRTGRDTIHFTQPTPDPPCDQKQEETVRKGPRVPESLPAIISFPSPPFTHLVLSTHGSLTPRKIDRETDRQGPRKKTVTKDRKKLVIISS